MTKIEKIEQEVRKLSSDELAAFLEWFHGYVSDEWDEQIEKDIRAGRLEKLAEKALAEHKAGKTKEF